MERNHKLDFLRAFAIICVLVIHTTNERYAHTDTEFWISAWLNTFTRPCIAIFIFLAGYLFRQKNLDLDYLFRKYQRVLVPYLFFALLTILERGRSGTLGYVSNHFQDILYGIVTCDIRGIYYYIFVIVILYTLAFIVLKNEWLSDRVVPITLGLFALNLLHGAYYGSIANSLGLVDASTSIVPFYHDRFLFYWPFFMFLGILFRRHNWQQVIDSKQHTVLWFWIAIFVSYNVLFFLNVDNIYGYNSVIGTFYSIATIAVLLLSNIHGAVVTFLSQISYSIYLTHYFFLSLLDGLEVDLGLRMPLWFSIFRFTLILGSSILVYVIGKQLLKRKSVIVLGA
jgi:surface polysaccharide O-acyltransferase-like enzyme